MDALNHMVVTDIQGVFTVSSPKGRLDKTHNRPCYGLSFCIEGQITYIHNGKKFVSDPDHAIILPKGQSYTIHGDKKGIFPVINFDCLHFPHDTFIVLPIRNLDSYIRDYEQIKNLILFERNRAKIISIFYDMMHRLYSFNRWEADVLFPAMMYLEKHYSSPELTNTVLAGQCNISEVYFRKLFAKMYGITPKQYIIDTRINKAKHLLTDGILRVNAVSEECGFSNPYHFCRVFKQKTGLTPTEFMKQNRIYKMP